MNLPECLSMWQFLGIAYECVCVIFRVRLQASTSLFMQPLSNGPHPELSPGWGVEDSVPMPSHLVW